MYCVPILLRFIMATLLPNGITISSIADQHISSFRKFRKRQRHYEDASSTELVVNRSILCDHLRFNGIRASLNQVDVLPYDHLGDQYGDAATISDTPNAPVAILSKRNLRSDYRHHVITATAVNDPDIVHRFFKDITVDAPCSEPLQDAISMFINTAPK